VANRALDFTAGGQLFEAYWNMFIASLRPVFWAAIFCATVVGCWLLWNLYQPLDFYYAMIAGLSKFWTVMGFSPEKMLNVQTDTGRVMVRMRNVDLLPQVGQALDRWTHILSWMTVAFLGGGLLLGGLYIRFAEHLSRNTRKRTHERGAAITDAASLAEMIADDNAQKLKAEQASPPPKGERTSTTGFLDTAAYYTPYTIAGVPWPWRTEPTHFMAMGTTGTGKSTVLQDILTQVRARKGRAVVFDLTGSFVERFYDPERDVILNALDTRCPHWSIFHECRDKVELQGAASALIPHDGGSSEPFWTEAARMLFVEACDRLIEQGRGTNEALYTEIMTSVLPNLFSLVQGTVAGPISDPEAKRMAESVRGVLNASAQAIGYLPDDGQRFSIREWVQHDDGKGGILFISATTTQLAALKSILTLWYDTAIYALMEMSTSPREIRMWFLFDELAALHRLPSLENGMRTARNFGGVFVLGVHTIQQLWSIYGRENGDTIASLGRTKLFLAQPDTSSAEWCSKMIGSTEYKHNEKSTTVGVERIRDGIGYSQKTEYRAIALPEQIADLPSLDGYLKMPEGYPVARIRLSYVKYPPIAKPYIKRELIRRKRAGQPAPKKNNGDESRQEKGAHDSKTTAPEMPALASQHGNVFRIDSHKSASADTRAAAPADIATGGPLQVPAQPVTGAGDAPAGQMDLFGNEAAAQGSEQSRESGSPAEAEQAKESAEKVAKTSENAAERRTDIIVAPVEPGLDVDHGLDDNDHGIGD